MSIEWCLLAVLFIATLLLVSRHFRSRALLIVFLSAGVALVASGLTWQRHLQRLEVSRKESREKLPLPRREPYVSSAACRACHPQQYASWHRSFHRTMTQVASPESVRG